MAKQTLILKRQERAEGRIGLDGSRVYVLHPDDPLQIVEIPHPTEAAARETIKTVIQRFFDPRLGWKVTSELADIDVSSWRPKPTQKPPPMRSPEETAAEQAANDAVLQGKLALQRARQMGWLVDGTAMVLFLEKQMHDGDLEIALVDNAPAVTTLHVLLSADDDDGSGREKLFARLRSDGVPLLAVLSLESGADYDRNRPEPDGFAYKLARRPLRGLPALLEQRALRELAAIGRFALPSAGALQSLERLRLHTELSMTDFDRIGEARQLRVLELIAGASIRDGIPRLPLAQLEELALEWVDDVANTITALLDAGRDRLPSLVHLQGETGSVPALHAAIERWRQESPASKLTFGRFSTPIDTLGIEQRASKFSPGAELRHMSQPWTTVRETFFRA